MNKMKSAKFDNEFIKTLLKEKEGLNLDFKQKNNLKRENRKNTFCLCQFRRRIPGHRNVR